MTPDQIETATAEQQHALLEAAWRKLRGDEYVKTGVNHFYRFQALLDAEAYLDAALMLVPEGWETAIYLGGENTVVQMETEAMRQRMYFYPIEGLGATPALAICAAILRAKETNDDT
jgi:hypothetical protein